MQDILRKAGVLVQIFSMPRRGHNPAMLDRVIQEHALIVEALEAKQPQEVRKLLAAHIQNSMRERLQEFDVWERKQMMTASGMSDSTNDASVLMI
jgi:DNA-binding GntR family transcriptional regulator